MMTLFMVRHAQSTFNVERRIQGHLDPPLSELGIKQAEAVARRLKGEGFSAVYSSDLERARATAEACAQRLSVSVSTTPQLREANLGVVQGLTDAEMDARYPPGTCEWRRHPDTMRPPGAETRERVIERCAIFLREINERHPDGGKLLVVGHGGSLRGLVIAACGLPAASYTTMHFANASLSILEIGERSALRLLNDTSHLRSLVGAEEDTDEA